MGGKCQQVEGGEDGQAEGDIRGADKLVGGIIEGEQAKGGKDEQEEWGEGEYR